MVTDSVSSPLSVTENQAFDVFGRVTQSRQTTGGTAYNPMMYTYNLSGALVEEAYPSGRVVKNVLNNDGDLSIVRSKKNSTAGYWNYADSFTYSPAGTVTSLQLGNGYWESTQFNSRLQPTQIALGTLPGATNTLKLDYAYGKWVGQSLDATKNNGNIGRQTITVTTKDGELGFTQKYDYDSVNRLKDARETNSSDEETWRQVFTYDRYGNRNFDETYTTTLTKTCGSLPNFTVCAADRKIENPSISTSTNRIVQDQDGDSVNDYTFDFAGNTIRQATGMTFIYDGENKQVEVKNSSNVTIGQYWYDGDEKRVKKYVPGTGETTVFVYSAAGKLVAEYSTELADKPEVAYTTTDNLGSPRINTGASGNVIARHDYHPFGEEISTGNRTEEIGYKPDDVRKQFTGYERDDETGLDFAQARMYGSLLGRFTTTDPALASATKGNPQTWNRYCYVLNNPYLYTDPLGLWEEPVINQTQSTYQEGVPTTVTDVSITIKMEKGDTAKTLATQLKISEKSAQKLLDTMDKDGNIRVSAADGKVGDVFKAIEKRVMDHENARLKKPDKGNEQGWDCSRTTGSLAGFFAPVGGPNGLDRKVEQKFDDGAAVNAENVSKEKLTIGDMVRFAEKGGVAKHWATFVMNNSSGEPVVFSKSGTKGPNEFGTTQEIARRNNYPPVSPNGQDKTGYYRKLPGNN